VEDQVAILIREIQPNTSSRGRHDDWCIDAQRVISVIRDYHNIPYYDDGGVTPVLAPKGCFGPTARL